MPFAVRQATQSLRWRLAPAASFWIRAALVMTIGLGSVTLANQVPVDKAIEEHAIAAAGPER